MTEIIKKDVVIGTVGQMLKARKKAITSMLPAHVKPEQFLRVALMSIEKSPGLRQCSPPSLTAAILEASSLGLLLDGVTGQGYLVPFRSKGGGMRAQFIPGYKGLCMLAWRSGEVGSIEARVVRAGDVFSYRYGIKPELTHIPGEGAYGDVTHAYCLIRWKHGGEPFFHVMPRADLDRIREFSKAKGDETPWALHFEEMAKKTVTRAALDYAPLSTDALSRAVGLDHAYLSPEGQALEADFDLAEEEEEERPIIEPKPATDPQIKKLWAIAKKAGAVIEKEGHHFIAVPPDLSGVLGSDPVVPNKLSVGQASALIESLMSVEEGS